MKHLAASLVLATALCSCQGGKHDRLRASDIAEATAEAGIAVLVGCLAPEPEPEPEPSTGWFGVLLDCLLD